MKKYKIPILIVTTILCFFLFNISTNRELIQYYKKQEKELLKQIKDRENTIKELNKNIIYLQDSVQKTDKEIGVIDNKISKTKIEYENKIKDINTFSTTQLDSSFSARLPKNRID